MLFFTGFGHYTVASSEDFQLSSKLISKLQFSKSDDITRAATFAQGSANRVRSVGNIYSSPCTFHAFA